VPLLDVQQVTAGYGARRVLHGITLAVEAGELVAVLGRNGAGKTTLLRVASGLLRPDAGGVRVDGRDLAALSARAAARLVGGVPQDDPTEFDFTVREVVTLGRYAHVPPWRAPGPDDRAAIDAALTAADLVSLADRPVTQVSGGERRRASLARCLAQDAAVLLLDEPTSHLDLGHETRVLGVLRDLAHRQGRAVVAALHDVNLAALFADRVVLLEGGRILAQGRPGDVLTEATLRAAFGATVRVLPHPDRPGIPVIVPTEGAP
jgi:iron complex transport system ATP-binding protein